MQSIGQLLEEALLHFEKKEYVKAGKLVDELLASNPEFHRGWFLKGVILEETGRPAEAEKCYRRRGTFLTCGSASRFNLRKGSGEGALVLRPCASG